ncbi:hypothetical protein SD70_16425 [Gordoniibacillus kamchatkensis]|uniref:WYL domain-containing protein n=1 Tax=Gordoniibacillus kamchatkensis TaxID=1590651 RepID=A0ABR5AFY1_9BACL|nr:hypothetical protein [Paenibacillus sp. VKM B-2647]KIL39973.1 hypothetical protein SD70_16425 [Paenibacillus sp. VKM B-2647]
MLRELQRYVGRTVVMIYLDRSGVFTKRKVRIYGIRDGIVNVYCYERRAVRTLKAENILAVMPVMRRAS